MAAVNYNSTANTATKKKTLQTELRLLQEQQSQIKEQNSIAEYSDSLIRKALKLGIEKEQWLHLNVDIKEEVTVYELADLLNQCSNKHLIYYKPDYLKIKKIVAKKKEPGQKTKQYIPNAEKKDFFVSLKGTFIVKNK